MEKLENKTFDEIELGDSARLERRLSERDIDLFAALSGDLNPTHMDEEYAESSELGEVVGHSMWGGTLFSTLLGNVLPGPGTTYRSQNLRFHRSLALGDTLIVSVTATEKHDDGVVVFNCQGVNQDDELVISGSAEVLAPRKKVVVERPEMPGVMVADHEGYEKLIDRCEPLDPIPTAVAHPCDQSSLAGALEAGRAGLIVPLLVGPEAKIRAVAEEYELDLSGLRFVDAPHSHAAAGAATELVREGEAEMLMKGSLHTDELMGAVVSSAAGLRTERRISHAFVMDVPTYPKMLIVTDAAINIAPDVEAKRDICQNAIDLARVLGVAEPKVAILSAVETVTKKIPSTMEAAALCKMADRGQITGGVLDGPLAMDNAISPEAARTKGIDSPVAGVADILLAPDLEAGNILAKQLTFLARADAAGIVLGARVPVILTSRADSVRTRMASCAVAMLQAHARRGDMEDAG
jgi:phosphate acetyltransferase